MSVATFRHEALLYAGTREFLEGTSRFIRDGLSAGEPTLVVVTADKIEGLKRELGHDAERVTFADMAEVGKNPARIIPAWRDFVDLNAGVDRPLRGIGEPICTGRDAHEVVECQRHESLLNVAFADARPFWLLCPYDTTEWDADVITEAERSHPYVSRGRDAWESAVYTGLAAAAAAFDRALPESPAAASELAFDAQSLPALRGLVRRQAARAGMRTAQIADLVLAVHEVASNSVRHGGGRGTARVWQDGSAVVCEIRDRGYIAHPMAGREQPPPNPAASRGLWVVNHLCDLVQIRALEDGGAVRLRMRAS